MVSGTTIGICIPTINQAQLLEESLEVLVAQHEHFAKIIVIDNGAQQISTRHPKLEILEQNENLGVAASWNLGLDSLFSDPSITHVLTINDDVALGANQLNVVIKLLDENPEKWFFSGQHQLSVWAMSRECYNVFHETDSEVFDQGFYPAYFEDKDFRHRLRHRDDTKVMNQASELTPEVIRTSQSIKKDPSLNKPFEQNRKYYVAKWGGEPGSEKILPGDNPSIEDRYRVACNRESDVNEHLPTIRRYAAMCDHVTEMGVRTAVSTWALMAAKPREIVCYDVQTHPNIKLARWYAIREGIQFEFHKRSVLEIDIAPTDLLFIDTLHSYNQLRTELFLHLSNVRRFVLLHDTVTFGFKDDPLSTVKTEKVGLVAAIDEFLKSDGGSFWKLRESFDNNNGLTVLERTNQLGQGETVPHPDMLHKK